MNTSQNIFIGIVSCYQQIFPYSNIFISKYSIPVYWGDISVLDADLICYRQLLDRDKRWNVVINPAESQLPLKTINQIRASLIGLKGRGVIEQYENPVHFRVRQKTPVYMKR